MNPRRGFNDRILARIRDDKMLTIRAGTDQHRFIGIWAVVVEGRVFVRSWSMKPRSWYRTFLEEPRGAIKVGGKVPALKALAPTQKEPSFLIVQVAVLALFGVLAVLATRRFRAEPARAAS